MANDTVPVPASGEFLTVREYVNCYSMETDIEQTLLRALYQEDIEDADERWKAFGEKWSTCLLADIWDRLDPKVQADVKHALVTEARWLHWNEPMEPAGF